MFQSKKVSNIVACSVYGAFLLAGIIIFLVGCGNMAAANENGLMGLFLGIFVLGLPIVPYLAERVVKNKLLKTVLSIVGYVLLYGVLALNILFSTMGGDGTGSPYETLGLSSTISTVLTLFLFYIRRDEEELGTGSRAERIGYDVLNIVIYALPFLAYLLAFLLLLFFNLLISFMIVGAFYLVMAAFIAVGAAHGGMILSIICNGALALATVICSIAFGAQPANHGLDYAARPLDTLVFLPCLFAVYFIPLTVSAVRSKPVNDLYVIISRFASLPAIFYRRALVGRARCRCGDPRRAVHRRLPSGHEEG